MLNFKKWLILAETIDQDTKTAILKTKWLDNQNNPISPEQIQNLVNQIDQYQQLVSKKDAFTTIRKELGLIKQTSDTDSMIAHYQQVPGTTNEELQTLQYFIKQNISKNQLKELMELLRKFISKKLIHLKIEDNQPTLYKNNQKLNTPDFTRFISQLHALENLVSQGKSKQNYFNPIEEELNHDQHLVAKGNNVWVFKGIDHNICKILGKNQTWCISSSSSAEHWFNYRMNYGQTQYFVFDLNKDPDDPARYVNPGVAPPGEYSEWVDKNNDHDTDPDDPNSEIGINGYNSIEQYKNYLQSMGIPKDIWKADPIQEWEKKLQDYLDDQDFNSAKNNEKIFPLYLKFVKSMQDEDFETLNDEQKKEFLQGKEPYVITHNQKDYIQNNPKFQSIYLNSLNIYEKIQYATITKDINLMINVAKNPELKKSEDVAFILNSWSHDKEKLEKIINALGQENMDKLDDDDFNHLIYSFIEHGNLGNLEIILQHRTNKINVNNIFHMFNALDSQSTLSLDKKSSENEHEVAKILGEKVFNDLTDQDVYNLIYKFHGVTKQLIAEIIAKYKKNITGNNIIHLLDASKDKDKIAKEIGEHNFNKLSDKDVRNLIANENNPQIIINIIKNYKKNLTQDNINTINKYQS